MTGLLALALALGASARTGSAAPGDTEPIRIEYTAPASCPDAGDFRGRVFGRTSKARPAEGAEPARTFVVVIESSGSTTEGSLVVREGATSTMARRVSGKNCDEVARALSLATALAIDPEASLGEPATTTGTSTSASADGADAGSRPAEPPREAPKPPPETRPEPEPPPPGDDERRFALLAGAAAAFGPAPTAGFGVSAAIEWSAPLPVLLPSALGLELVYLTSAEHAVSSATSSFDFFFARPYACTLGLALGATAGISPCVGAELGAVVGTGSDIARPATETRFWATGELALRLDLSLSDDWFLNATGALVVPFTRYRFVFHTPDTRIHDVPAVTAAAGLRLGRRF